MPEIALVSVAFLFTIALVILRFTTVIKHILDTSIQDRANRAHELDMAHERAFRAAMEALESINQRITDSQTDLLSRTLDSVAGPPSGPQSTEPYATDRPQNDNRPPWAPDDDWDYSQLGIDPTDDTMPAEPLEPTDNRHRAVMVPPGQGLLPPQDS